MIDATLLNRLPPLRRARGDRLYGPDDRHWVDLWKQDGAWLLGHRPEGAAKEWKNQVDKGLSAWAPSLWPRRLEQLVPRLLPGVVAVRIFRNLDRVPTMPVWRPWTTSPPELQGALRLVLPTGPGQAVAVVYGKAWMEAIPDHDVTSPAESAALVRAVAQVLRFTADEKARSARVSAAGTFDRLVGPAFFQRDGIWITGVGAPEDYPKLFQAHLDAGFLLNPDPLAPSVIPTELSAGEWSAWKGVVEALRGGTAWKS